MSRRGVFFARKFSTVKTAEILDIIDDRLLRDAAVTASTDAVAGASSPNMAGMYWPGHKGVDVDVASGIEEFGLAVRAMRKKKIPSPFRPL